jgi:aspartyl-tRNA(Asn)/glutamyl-tRNA(Gln) amidotransferase subunit C
VRVPHGARFLLGDALEEKTAIDRAEVDRIALLARLALDAEEAERLTGDLRRIVEYVAQIRTCDVEGVSAELDPDQTRNVLREDEVQPSLPQKEALKNAPDTDGSSFRVPAVLPTANK